MYRLSLFVGIMMISLSGAMRAQSCDIFNDKTDKYALGQYLIYSIHPELRTTAQFQKCIQAPTGHCTYHDDNKVEYDFINEEEDIAVAMEMTHPAVDTSEVDADYRGRLIADIKMGDSLQTVRRKLKSLPANFPSWEYEDDFLALVTECNIRSSNGAEWSYNLFFDRALRLNRVTAGEMNPVSTQ